MWNNFNKSMMFCQAMFGLSFYGVMVILTRFFLEDLGYSEADTMMVVGAFSSIGPLFVIAGGFIADKFLGAYRSLTIAYGTFSTGYALLVLGASTTNIPMSLVGIALASYARGLMSPSYPSLYKRTFSTEEPSVSLFSVAIALSGIVGAVFSTSIALEKGQQITQEIVQNVYGDYFQLLTVLAVAMVAIALVASVIIRKMLDAAREDEQPEMVEAEN